VAATFQNVEKAYDIGVDIGLRILQRVAHPGLRGKMDDRSELAVAEHGFREFAIGEIEPVKSEILVLAKNREPRLLECRIVIGIDIIYADNRAAMLKQPSREAKSDKACGAGDQNRILRHLILS